MEREGGISPRLSPLAQVCANLKKFIWFSFQLENGGNYGYKAYIFFQVRDARNLLTRAGFSLPGVDVDEYVVKYKSGKLLLFFIIGVNLDLSNNSSKFCCFFYSALDLIEHLRAMGETNALLERNKILNCETALATAAIYESMFATEDGTIPATFQVIYMTGWREHSSHQQAKRRGSATVSFTDLQKQFGGQS